jgi:hypothetical protein
MNLTLPGLGNPPGTPGERMTFRKLMMDKRNATLNPPAPAMPEMTEEEKRRKKAAQAAGNSTVLTSPSGVLGDPPLDRPIARSATMLG